MQEIDRLPKKIYFFLKVHLKIFLNQGCQRDLRHLMLIFWDETWYTSSLGQNLAPFFSLVVSTSGATYRAAWRPSLATRFWATGKSFRAEIRQSETLTKNLDPFLKFSRLVNPLDFYGNFSRISLEANFPLFFFHSLLMIFHTFKKILLNRF